MPGDDLFQVRRLNPKKGDTLAVKIDAHITSEQQRHLETYCSNRLPEGVKVIVLGRGMDLKLVRKPAPARKAAKRKAKV